VSGYDLKARVYYEDTDAGGVMYHASYLRFAERGRTEMLRAVGYEHAKLAKDTGKAFAVVSLNIDYKAPARLDDLLTIRSKIVRVGGASMDLQQNFFRDKELLAEIKVTLVCIDKTFKAVRLPAEIRNIFDKQEQGEK
jgi:acyl-CoA thioester hydrolase